MKLFLFGFLSVFILNNSKAQFVNYGQNPPSLQWKHLNSAHFNLIFPVEISWKAEKLSQVLERVYEVENHSLPVKTQPISIILQTQPIESNAFVLLAPRRSEFNTLPPQDLEPNDWLNSLAIHEMRHVVQIDRVFNGKGIPIFETLQLSIFGVVFPTWFFEGDAVGMETLLSDAGRGRLPYWEVDLRANLLSGKNYSYSKYTLGSLKDNVPDYYRIGYFMVTKMRRDYGDSVFNKIYTGSLHLKPYPFSSSLRKQTGYNTNQFYHRTVDELKSIWTNKLKGITLPYYESVNKRVDSTTVNFLLPKPYTKNKILFLKEGLNDLPGIYSLNLSNRREHKILTIGAQTNPNFDYKNGVMVWDEIRNDPRFQYRTYSDIFQYDFKNHQKRKLTSRTKLFSPSLNPDGSKIAAVQVDPSYTFHLVILSKNQNYTLKQIPNPNNYFFETPSWDLTGTKIIATAVNSKGKALYIFDLVDSSQHLVKPFCYTELNHPVFGINNNLLFQSAKGGIDQIYSYSLANGKETQLTSVKFGAYNPQIIGDSIYFENFSALGKNISQISYSVESQIIRDTQNIFIHYYKPLLKKELGGSESFKKALMDDSIPGYNGESASSILNDSLKKPFFISPFHEASNLFYFHSLLPDIQNAEINVNSYIEGLKLTSTNLLNTTQTYAGIYYQNGVNSLEYQIGITYKKYFPEFLINFKDYKRNALAFGKDSIGEYFLPYSYRTRLLNFGIDIPLNFISSVQTYNVDFQVNTSFQNNYLLTIPLARFKNFNTYIKFPLHYSIALKQNRNRAARDINPKWGQNISLDFEHLPFSNNLKGHYFAINSGFYFPGLFTHHSLRLGFNYQYDIGIYQGQRSLDEINGFAYLPPNNLQNTFLVNYYFPISYPDLELGRFSYIKEIIGGLFYNRENFGSDPNLYHGYTTYGLDCRVNFNLLRFYLPIFQVGTKVIIFQDKSIKSPKFELVLTYNL